MQQTVFMSALAYKPIASCARSRRSAIPSTTSAAQFASAFTTSSVSFGRTAKLSAQSGRRFQPIVARAISDPLPNIIVQGRHLEVTEAIRAYVDEKVARAVSSFDVGAREVDVYCSVRHKEDNKGAKVQKTEVTVYTKYGIVRSVCEAETLYGSIDLVVDKVQRKLRKLKEKNTAKGQRHSKHEAGSREQAAILSQTILDTDVEAEPEFEFDEVVTEEFFEMEEMSTTNAIAKLENVNESFLVFINDASGELAVAYKKEAGGYGVKIPTDMRPAQ